MSISVKPENIKALAMDLDGTLLAPGNVLTERSISAISRCRQKGIKIIIATGRAIEAAEPYRVSLGADGPAIYYNGAVVADMPAGTPALTPPGAPSPAADIFSITLLDKDSVEFCIDLSRQMGIYYQAYFPGTAADPRIVLLTERDAPEREMYHKHTGILAELGDLKEALHRPEIAGCVKTMFLAEPEVQALIRPRLTEHFGGSVYIAQTYRSFLEVMNANVSKGQGLKIAMERLSLKPHEVIAFGDEENDLPMFSAAGFSAAPSGAKENVKAAASLVIGSNSEDGVAEFLEEFFGL